MAVNEAPVIVATGITKSYGRSTVLDGVDLTVGRGTLLALLGPNGAGKTTMVRILSTLLRADGGSATIGGFDVAGQAGRVRRLIGLTGQYASVDELLTGRENLVMIGRLHHLGRAAATRRAEELLQRFDLDGAAAGRLVKTYSGGMRRRLDLAASLIASPPIVFLDEPTTGLDPRSRQVMWQVIRDLLADGTTILLTTQYLEEADQLADRIVVIDHGRVVTEGTPSELKRQVGSERLDLTLADAADLVRARDLVAGELLAVDEAGRTVSLALGGAGHLRTTLERFELAGITVSDLAVSKPSLDDVFFSVTGARDLEGTSA